MKYVVKAPGRTGGHLIVDFLKSSKDKFIISENEHAIVPIDLFSS